METRRNTSYVYGIERHTLCLCSLAGDSLSNRFALGTLGIREDSEIHLVDFDSDEGTLASLVYKHPGGLRSLASAPWDPSLMLAINGRAHASTSKADVELVRLPHMPQPGGQVGFGTDALSTERIAALQPPVAETQQPPPHKVAFHPSAHSKQAAVVSPSSVCIYDLAGASPSVRHTVAAARNSMDDIEAAAWHPTAASQITTTDGPCVRTWDLRAKPQQVAAIEFAHSGKIRAVNHNPNLPYILATGGDDGAVRIWDTRNVSSALMEIVNHSHWVYALEFNPNHDQLLLSAGSDGLVNLESVVSVSSAHVVSELDAAEAKSSENAGPESLDNFDYCDEDAESSDGIGKPTDGLVTQFDDHETSVYAAHWSAADPWIFASLSFGGRMVINSVPREEKYKILL